MDSFTFRSRHDERCVVRLTHDMTPSTDALCYRYFHLSFVPLYLLFLRGIQNPPLGVEPKSVELLAFGEIPQELYFCYLLVTGLPRLSNMRNILPRQCMCVEARNFRYVPIPRSRVCLDGP